MMQASIVRALMPITTTIPVTLIVFDDSDNPCESNGGEGVPQTNIILQLEDDSLVPQPELQSATVGARSLPVNSRKKQRQDETLVPQPKLPAVTVRTRTLPINSRKKQTIDDSLKAQPKPQSVTVGARSLLIESSKKQRHRPSILKSGKSLSTGSLLKPVVQFQGRKPVDGGEEILIVRPEKVESTSSESSITSHNSNKSFLKPLNVSLDKSLTIPEITTIKEKSHPEPVIPLEGRKPVDDEEEILVVEPDIVESISSESSTTSQKNNKDLLKPEKILVDKSHTFTKITTRKENPLAEPVTSLEESKPVNSGGEEILVKEPDVVESTSSESSITSPKNNKDTEITTGKEGPVTEPVTTLKEREHTNSSGEEILVVEPDVVESTSSESSITTQKNDKDTLKPENIPVDKSYTIPEISTGKGGSVAGPVTPLEGTEPENSGGEEIITVEPRSTGSDSSITSEKNNKSLLKPENVSVDKSSNIPEITTGKEGPVTEPVSTFENSSGEEIIVVKPDMPIVESTSSEISIISQKRNKSLLKPEFVPVDKSHTIREITTSKEGSITEPLILHDRREPVNSGGVEVVVVELDEVESTSGKLSTTPQKSNKSLLKSENAFVDKSRTVPVFFTTKERSLLKPVILPRESDPVNCREKTATNQYDGVKSSTKQLLDLENVVTRVLNTVRPGRSLLKPTVVPNTPCPPLIMLPGRDERLQAFNYGGLDMDKRAFGKRVKSGGARSDAQKEVQTDSTSETYRYASDMTEDCVLMAQGKSSSSSGVCSADKKVTVKKKSDRVRSLLKHSDPATTKVCSTTTSIPVVEPVIRKKRKKACEDNSQDKQRKTVRKLFVVGIAVDDPSTTPMPHLSPIVPREASDTTVNDFRTSQRLVVVSEDPDMLVNGLRTPGSLIIPRQGSDLSLDDLRTTADGYRYTHPTSESLTIPREAYNNPANDLTADEYLYTHPTTGSLTIPREAYNDPANDLTADEYLYTHSTTGDLIVPSKALNKPEGGFRATVDGYLSSHRTTESPLNPDIPKTGPKKREKVIKRRLVPGRATAITVDDFKTTQMAKQSLAVLKNSLRKSKEKIHSRHRQVSSSASKVADLKTLIADLKSRGLITEEAHARLIKAVKYSLKVYNRNNFDTDPPAGN